MDILTPEKRSWNMSRIRSKDTAIEVRLRKALWHAGIRYRKNYKALPGKPDVAITKWRIAVFADSSFWHGRDLENGHIPKTRTNYWTEKIRRTMERDREVEKVLQSLGWTVLRFWDYEINNDLERCVIVVKEAIFNSQVLFEDPYLGEEIGEDEEEYGLADC